MTAIVCLGKHGDQLNALAIAYHFRPVDFIVSSAYASTILGASYVNPVRLSCGPADVPRALAYAGEKGYEKVLLAQAFGKHWSGRRDISFNEVAWLSCGLTSEQFHDTVNFPLVIDRRDKEREAFLVKRLVIGTKPLLLLSVGCARSSPFASHWIFTNAIRSRWGSVFEIINLCDVRAPRIFDLLALLDRARLIISSDTYVLHLATACTAPVIAFVNDKPWSATTTRRPSLLRLPYGEVIGNMRRVHSAIESVLQPKR